MAPLALEDSSTVRARQLRLRNLKQLDIVYPSSVSGSQNYSCEPPLGPIALYSSVPEDRRQQIRFLDSTIISQTEIEQAVTDRRADVVAVSCTAFNYCNALGVAEFAKRHGAIVVFGGIHVTYMRDAILNKMLRGERPVDYLISGYGEPAFGPLLDALENGLPVDGIPNLSYVADGRIIINPIVSPKFSVDPLTVPLDYNAVDLNQYSKNFHGAGNLSSASIVAPIYTQRGCAYIGNRKCTFCSIEEINPKRPAELFEADLYNLIINHNVDHVRINDGDFTLDMDHMSRISDAAERVFEKTGQKPVFHCFTRADEVDYERISILRRLNVVSVFIGYESGSDRMLRSMHKFTTCAQNVEATKLLKAHGIDVICAGFVLGAEGETEETLQETCEFVRELKAIGNTDTLLASPLIPIPGSPAFRRLIEVLKEEDPETARELIAADEFDLEALVGLWNRYLCHVSLDRVLEVCDEIESLFHIGIRYITMHDRNSGLAGKSS